MFTGCIVDQLPKSFDTAAFGGTTNRRVIHPCHRVCEIRTILVLADEAAAALAKPARRGKRRQQQRVVPDAKHKVFVVDAWVHATFKRLADEFLPAGPKQ